jgi:hypothetical protein
VVSADDRRGDLEVLRFLLLELQSSGINAVAGFGRFRAVMKKMAEMRATVAADHFCSFGEKADVFFQSNIADVDGFNKAGPAGAGLELGLGAKKRLSASCADIGTLIGAVPVFS